MKLKDIIKAILDNCGTYEKQQFNNGYVECAFDCKLIDEEEKKLCLTLIELLPY